MAIIGVSKPYYAKYGNEGTTVTYTEGAVMGKATKVNIAVEQSSSNDLYGDNGIAESDKRFSNGTLTISTTDLSQTVSRVILGAKEETITGITGVTDTSVTEMIYDDDMESPYLGVGFIIKKKVDGVLKWRAVVLPKVQFSVPADSAETEGETISWQVPELTGTIMRDDTEKHMWKREATFTTETQAEAYIKARLGIAA
nr:MAG TPA: tail tube protein [Caudoviricetes sp.]